VSEREIEAACAVGTEPFLELGGRLRFLIGDLRTELRLDPLQAFPRDRVPTVVVD